MKKYFFIFIFLFIYFVNYPVYASDYNDYAIHSGDILSNLNNKKIKILGNLLSLAGKFNLFSWEDPLICTINEGWFTDGLDCQTSDKLFNEMLWHIPSFR